MSGRSAIEWTEATWNPTTGCDRVSEGCDPCPTTDRPWQQVGRCGRSPRR
ncbi:DUF5131 family protein [Streptomyces mirabilis]